MYVRSASQWGNLLQRDVDSTLSNNLEPVQRSNQSNQVKTLYTQALPKLFKIGKKFRKRYYHVYILKSVVEHISSFFLSPFFSVLNRHITRYV